MIFYSWTALRGSGRAALRDSYSRSAELMVAMGITDDRGRAMRAGAETLGAGQAKVVIIEAVRPAMARRTLAPCYVPTGVGWMGRRTGTGEVAWNRFFIHGDPDGRPPPGRMGP